MITYMFPGQGSQIRGMGGSLFDEYSNLTEIADEILGYSIKELCLHDPDNHLSQTQYTQPAVYTVTVLMYLKKTGGTDGKPDYFAGHSLGEYCALFAASAFDFETGLKLVQKRGQLMSRAVGGGMAAVMGLHEDVVQRILVDCGLATVTIANYNTPSQIVISGLKEDIIKARPVFEKAGVDIYIPLDVSGAFHSQHMVAAREEFEKFIGQFDFSEPAIPVISNVNARPYRRSDIKKNLVEQITSPVRWTDSILYLMGKGEMVFEEVGPGSVLKKLISRIRHEADTCAVNQDEKFHVGDRAGDANILKENQDIKKPVGTDMRNIDEIQRERTEMRATTKSIKRGNYEEEHSQRQPSPDTISVTAQSLGCIEYREAYGLAYAYAAGGMYGGIASKELVASMGKAGMIGYFGSGGLDLRQVDEAIRYIQAVLKTGEAYGMNLLSSSSESQLVDLYLRSHVANVEAAGYIQITPALVLYRLKGLCTDRDGLVISPHRIMAKLSRPEVAEEFLRPAPEQIVKKLLEERKISDEEAALSMRIAMADDICVEADSGGHSQGGSLFALMPAIQKLRDDMMKKYRYARKIRIGAAGGIGTPGSAAAAFILGADFIITGSINQCTVEAGTSDAVKDMLQGINIQDTAHAPAGDMFEFGTKVQVLKKGIFFPVRANKLYDIYQRYGSLDEIDTKIKKHIEDKYFKRTCEDVFNDITKLHPNLEIQNASKNGKNKMAVVFKWYIKHAFELALNGKIENVVDFQIMCGPALGAFNQWVKGSELENWRNRHVDQIGKKIMVEAAQILIHQLLRLTNGDEKIL